MDYHRLGPTPIDEDCLQAGVSSIEDCRAECVRYKELLEQVLPIPSHLTNVRYDVKFFPYEGVVGYHEVVVYFDDNNEEECDFVFEHIDPNLPTTWQ